MSHPIKQANGKRQTANGSHHTHPKTSLIILGLRPAIRRLTTCCISLFRLPSAVCRLPAFAVLFLILNTTWISCGPATQSAAPNPPASLENDPTELLSLKSITTVPVQNISTSAPFFITKRTEHITQYPCASCHTTPVTKPQQDDISQRWSHLNIQLTHGKTTGLDCQSCHNYDNFEKLQLQNGKTTDFDHSYELCRQCHFQQANDWVGGAHGKRLAGWRGKRVINNCTDCHNPHTPAFDQRIPVKAPTIPRTGGTH